MTSRSRLLGSARCLTSAALVVCTACFTSPSPRRAALVRSRHGETVTVHLTAGYSREGELLGTSDSTLVLLVGERVVVGRFVDIRGLSLRSNPSGWFRPGTREAAKPLARASRFPFGVTDVALAALLVQAKQSTPEALVIVPQ